MSSVQENLSDTTFDDAETIKTQGASATMSKGLQIIIQSLKNENMLLRSELTHQTNYTANLRRECEKYKQSQSDFYKLENDYATVSERLTDAQTRIHELEQANSLLKEQKIKSEALLQNVGVDLSASEIVTQLNDEVKYALRIVERVNKQITFLQKRMYM